jgi:hypothetical protein
VKKTVLVFLAGFIVLGGMAQDKTVEELRKEAARDIKKEKDPNDTIPKTWKKGGLFNLNFGQTSLTNWAAGGDQLALNFNSFLNLFAYYKKDKHAWDNSLDLSIGYVKTTSLGTRKADDRIDLLSKYGYEIFHKVYLSALFNLRTQFTEGFNYPKADSAVKVSAFFSPAYVLLAVGLDWKPNDDFSLFISPATSRWVIVLDDSLSAQGAYGVEPGENARYEIGAYLSANYKKEFIKNFVYKGKLDLFANYRNKPKNVDLFMTNLLSMNFFKGLSASIGLDMIYDDDVRIFGPESNSPRLQLRQYVGIGYAAKF